MRKLSLSLALLALVAVGMLSISSCEKEPDNTINGHEYVDLGLPSGLKWATCNVGANNPEEYGNYYAWGEIVPKTDYSYENCATMGQQFGDISGNASYDAATANWGAPWRMPTKEEMKELIDNCTFKWTTQNGTTGTLVTGKNGNTIFFPANGYYLGISYYKNALCGYYWSANGETIIPNSASFFLKLSNEKYLIDWFTRYYGYGVRPVSD